MSSPGCYLCTWRLVCPMSSLPILQAFTELPLPAPGQLISLRTNPAGNRTPGAGGKGRAMRYPAQGMWLQWG